MNISTKLIVISIFFFGINQTITITTSIGSPLFYWFHTQYSADANSVWRVRLNHGSGSVSTKDSIYPVCCVRRD